VGSSVMGAAGVGGIEGGAAGETPAQCACCSAAAFLSLELDGGS